MEKGSFLERFSSHRLVRTLALTALLSTTSFHYVEKEPVPIKNPVWIIGEEDLSKFIDENSPLAERLFNSPSTFVIDTDQATLPETWKANVALPFASYAEFEEAIDEGIDPQIDAVVYDNEGWDRTPLEEQENAIEYTKKFADLAHENGLLFINAPHVSLAAANGRMEKGLSVNWDFYMNIVRNAARYSDVLVLQLQWAVYDKESYNDFLIEAREVALEEAAKYDRGLLVLGEISTTPEIPEATVENLHSIIAKSLTEVNGMWLLLNHRDKGVGSELLDSLKAIYPPKPLI